MQRAHRIMLASEQRRDLEAMLRKSRHAPRCRACILLEADETVRRPRRTDRQVAALCGVSARTVARVRERFVTVGFAEAVSGKPRAARIPKLTAAQEVQLMTLACSAPPAGYARWSFRLLSQHVELLGLPPMSPGLLHRTLKKITLTPDECSTR